MAAAEPKVTLAWAVKPVPVTVTWVPPATGPVAGLTPLTVGAARLRTGAPVSSYSEAAELPAVML